MFQFRKRVPETAPDAVQASATGGSLRVPRGPSTPAKDPAPALPGRGVGPLSDLAQPQARAVLDQGEPAGSPSKGPHRLADPAAAAPGRSSEELLGENSRRLNLVGGNALAASVDQAVRRALAKHMPDLGSELVGEVARTTRGMLVALLKSRSKKVRGLPKADFLKEVEASKRKIVAEREAARRELEALLEELGKKHVEFRQDRETLVRRTFDKGLIQDQELSEIIYQALGGPDATPEMRRLQRQLTDMVLESLQRERQKAVEEKTSEHGDELRRYELRIAKLTKSLELTEEELKRIAAMKNIDPGVASIYRTIQGLSAEDQNAEAKKEMLSGIFQANLALQKQTVRAVAG